MPGINGVSTMATYFVETRTGNVLTRVKTKKANCIAKTMFKNLHLRSCPNAFSWFDEEGQIDPKYVEINRCCVTGVGSEHVHRAVPRLALLNVLFRWFIVLRVIATGGVETSLDTVKIVLKNMEELGLDLPFIEARAHILVKTFTESWAAAVVHSSHLRVVRDKQSAGGKRNAAGKQNVVVNPNDSGEEEICPVQLFRSKFREGTAEVLAVYIASEQGYWPPFESYINRKWFIYFLFVCFNFSSLYIGAPTRIAVCCFRASPREEYFLTYVDSVAIDVLEEAARPRPRRSSKAKLVGIKALQKVHVTARKRGRRSLALVSSSDSEMEEEEEEMPPVKKSVGLRPSRISSSSSDAESVGNAGGDLDASGISNAGSNLDVAGGSQDSQ